MATSQSVSCLRRKKTHKKLDYVTFSQKAKSIFYLSENAFKTDFLYIAKRGFPVFKRQANQALPRLPRFSRQLGVCPVMGTVACFFNILCLTSNKRVTKFTMFYRMRVLFLGLSTPYGQLLKGLVHIFFYLCTSMFLQY